MKAFVRKPAHSGCGVRWMSVRTDRNLAMRAYKVDRVAIPPETTLSSWFANAQLADAYAIRLPAAASSDPAALASAALGSLPPGGSAIMFVRDMLVRPFGIKTTPAIAQAGWARHHAIIGFFPVLERLGDEIILGEDDRHLDFRISFMVRERGAHRELVWTSVVRTHGFLGNAYLAAVRPFHRLAINLCLTTAAWRGWPGEQGRTR